MAKVYPDGAVVRNIMADGTECDDLSTYIKSADQLPDLTKRLIVYFCERGAKMRLEQEREQQKR